MMRILVTGAKGQLGSEIKKIAQELSDKEFIFADKKEMPLEDTEAINDFLNNTNPDLILSAGAYTAVDKAETEKELSEKINHYAIDTISKWCTKKDAKLIHISTDYVFDGKSNALYKEDDLTSPINWYGETKLRGEKAIFYRSTNAVVIRTSWVYSEYGHNFVKTMLRLMKEHNEIGVVSDQIGTPTYARDLAKNILAIIDTENWKTGIYHYSNIGKISWYDFAVAIADFSKLTCKVNAVSSDQFPTEASRPQYSVLDKTKITSIYGVKIPEWKDSLKECLTILNQ